MTRKTARHEDREDDNRPRRPEAVRGEPEHPLAPFPALARISTDGIPSRETYDFWREAVFYNFAADRHAPEQGAAFCGAGAAILSAEADFYSYRSDAVSGQRTQKLADADGRDRIELGMVFEGRRRYRLGNDEAGIAGTGNFFVFDETLPTHVSWQAHRGAHLTLDRRAVEQALGCPIPTPEVLTEALDRSPQARILGQQLALVAANLDLPDPDMHGMLLHQTRELALYTLGRLGFSDNRQERAQAALVTAAQRLIERRYADPDFGVAELVGSLGCSRSTLYRAFAAQGVGIADAIRDFRLGKVQQFIEAAGDDILISEIAMRCGFYDLPNFNRVFRRRFGVNPREMRANQVTETDRR